MLLLSFLTAIMICYSFLCIPYIAHQNRHRIMNAVKFGYCDIIATLFYF